MADERPFDLVVRADRLVTGTGERAACVAVRDGRIVAVLPGDARVRAGRVVELAADEVLLPGLVDTHVHVNEPGRTEWEGFETATRAAAAGGVTTIVDMPLNSIPPTIDVRSLEVKRAAAAGKCHVDVGFWGGAVPANADDLAPLHAAGVYGFKCFLVDSGVPEFPPLSVAELGDRLARLADLDAQLIVHAEDAAEIAAAPDPAGVSYFAFLESRPQRAEVVAVAHVLDAAARTGARVHVLHLSSADAVPLIAAARADGVRVTVETCPHYLYFDAESVADGATQFKCCPPIRERENRERLWDALASGVIDVVVSDHSPCVAELKRMDSGDFGLAWGGISSLQLRLAVTWTAAQARSHSLSDVVRWCAERPAELAGVEGKGRVEVGFDADLCVLAPDEEFTVDETRLQHRNAVTPYAGKALRGVVRQTWLRGEQLTGDAATGRLLVRGEARG